MLVLTVPLGSGLMIGDDIKLEVRQVWGKECSLGIQAPLDVDILRDDAIVRRPTRRRRLPPSPTPAAR